MSNAAGVVEGIERVLHEMCQPLTTLQCRLEMAGLVGTLEGCRVELDQALAECSRLAAAVGSMREILRTSRLAGDRASRGSG